MKKLKIVFKLLPIIGDFIQDVKSEPKKDARWWTNSVVDLVRTILTTLAAIGLISGDLPF